MWGARILQRHAHAAVTPVPAASSWTAFVLDDRDYEFPILAQSASYGSRLY